MNGPLSTDRQRATANPAWKNKARRRRRRRRIPSTVKYGLWVVAAIIVLLIARFVYRTATQEPLGARTVAERELRLNTLGSGEHVIREVSVFQRPALDYFRATRGLLVLTDRRLLFLGLAPRDFAAASDEPPTFTERDFPLDTTVHVTSGRTFFWFARAIVIETPGEELRLGVPSPAWPRAEQLLAAVDVREEAARSLATERGSIRATVDSQVARTVALARAPRIYVVQRGDALASVANRWNTTPEQLQAWNRLPSNRIKIGQKLIVKPAR
ncbi:MAG TPA: LysM peptidoglycan-binding domain-containing protein [Gemmatimonadaceae bacterium]